MRREKTGKSASFNKADYQIVTKVMAAFCPLLPCFKVSLYDRICNNQ